MGLKDRISNWREGESEASRKREQKRRRRAREDAAAAEQKALASRDKPTAAKPSEAESKPSGRKAKPSGRPGPKAKASDPKAGPPEASRRRTAADDARRVGTGVASVGLEVAKLAREMLVIPLQLWLAAAEIAGKGVLAAWLRFVLPLLRAVGRLAGRSLRFAERHVTPARAVAATAIVAAGALAASQWLDYHSVTVGSDAYSGTVGIVAPAPEVEAEIAGNAHSWAMLPLALVAIVALVVALAGRRRAAFALVGVGVVVIAISLAVDAPKGLDEGQAAVAYEGASASLLEGFWMQIATGAVLIASGLLLPYYLRPAPAGAAARRPTGPTPAAVIATRARRVLGRVRLPRPKLGRGAATKRKGKVQGART